MVVIRLARIGKKKQAFYRVVVADSRRPVKAKFIEILGWYNPYSKELNIKKDLLERWLGQGARPSNSLAVLLKKEGFKLPSWVEIKEKVKKPKKSEKKTEDSIKENESSDDSVGPMTPTVVSDSSESPTESVGKEKAPEKVAEETKEEAEKGVRMSEKESG
jgi:small subunit ribosomal protein S16